MIKIVTLCTVNKQIKLLLEKKALLVRNLFIEYKLIDENNHFSIIFVNNEKMKLINLKYKKINSTTDVLTFLNSFCDMDNYLGDAFINYDYLKLSDYNEFVLIIIHSILHFLKYNHSKKNEAKIMFELQDKLYNEYKRLYL